MSYIFKQKLNLMEFAPYQPSVKIVVIAEPEEYLLNLYSSYLENHSFQVRPCNQLDAIHSVLNESFADLLILSAEFYKNSLHTRRLITAIKKKFPPLPLVTIGYNLTPAELKEFMSAGISSHIDRRFSRPEDVAIIAKTILNN